MTTTLYAQSTKEVEERLWNFFDKGAEVAYIDKDSAYYYFEKAGNLAKLHGSVEDQLYILSYAINTSDYHFDLKTSAKILKETDSLLSIENISDGFEDYDSYLASYLAYQGNYYYKLGAYERAKGFFLRIQAKYNGKSYAELEEDEADALFRNNNFLGVIYKNLGKYDLSEQYYLTNGSLVEQNQYLQVHSNAYLTNVNQLLAQLYIAVGKPLKANELLEKSLEYYKVSYQGNPKFKNNLVNAYQQITNNYIAQDSLVIALKYLDESQEYLLPKDPFYKYSFMLYGDIFKEQGKNQKALNQYNKALKILKEYRQNQPHQDLAKAYAKFAELYLKGEDYLNGLNYIQLALEESGLRVELNGNKENPKPEEIFSKRQLLYLLNLKLQLLQLAFTDTKDKRYLNTAIKTNYDILGTFDLLKKEFESKMDKQFLAQTAYPIFHRMLDLTYIAYQYNPKSETLVLAINIAEKNKDFVLLEALRNTNAIIYGNVPKDVLEKEAQLRAEITRLEKNLFDAIEKRANFSRELLTLKEGYYTFLDSLKINYPKYYELKYGTESLDLETIRAKLVESDGLLISFSVSEKQLYTFVFEKTGERFLKTEFDDTTKKEIRDFYRFISKPSISKNDEDIKALSNSLYKKILENPLQEFKGKNLTIVADDLLHYLPFDVLQDKDKYVVMSFNVGYANSLSSLLELKAKRSTARQNLLAFAPSFDDETKDSNERKFGKLHYNSEEVKTIENYVGGESYFDVDATLSNFMELAPKYQTIHLATHASANDEFADFSYLAFTKESDSSNSNILYIKDLYNINLSSNMVVLSACQTGIGKLQKGQGMMSLSKGFYYAGAKSLVTTLWKINDKSNVSLMDYFYENLSEGKSKTEALRNAKLKYLENTEDELLKHPYYWAGFVVSGNVEPLQSSNPLWLWALLALLIFVSLWYLKKKKSV